MDQSAFRQLLTSTSSSVESKDGGDISKKNAGKRFFGKQQKRKFVGGKGKEDLKDRDLLPRKLNKRKDGEEEDDDDDAGPSNEYTDRAKARGMGKDEMNEFHEVEILKKDFEKRMEDAQDESERKELRKQMAYLGGDAKHTVLVNGLDFALLEQQRAKLNESGDRHANQSLEDAFGSGNLDSRQSSDVQSKPSASGMMKGFKPIGSSNNSKDESPEYIWRDGKRMRKKRKNKQEEVLELKDGNAEVRVVNDQSKAKKVKATPVKVDKEERSLSNTKVEEVTGDRMDKSGDIQSKDEKAQSLVKSTNQNSDAINSGKQPTIEEDDIDNDDDIFADAGRWAGFDEERDDEEEEEGHVKS